MAQASELDFPIPKYRIGQRVFYASEISDTVTHPCPDCLGTKLWKVITPAGAELEAACQRCGSYSSRDIPSLQYRTWVASVQPLTIGSIQIDTNAGRGGWREDPVRYMCSETGVGSGSVYNESKLFASEDDAKVAAEALAVARCLETENTPKRLEQKHFSHLSLKDAELDQCRGTIWQAWYSYRRLREDIEGHLEDQSLTAKELRESVEQAHDWEAQHREPPLLEQLIAHAALTGDDKLQAAVKDLPFKPIAPPPDIGAGR
jgi:hypothetical protein